MNFSNMVIALLLILGLNSPFLIQHDTANPGQTASGINNVQESSLPQPGSPPPSKVMNEKEDLPKEPPDTLPPPGSPPPIG